MFFLRAGAVPRLLGPWCAVSLSAFGLACDSETDDAVQSANVTQQEPSPSVDKKPAKVSEPKPAPQVIHPAVGLDGKPSKLALNPVAPGPRIHAKHLRAWVYEKANRQSRRLGYLRAGASSPTTASPVGRSGCAGGWYPVEPEGFTCAGKRATLDANDPVVRLFVEHPPRADQRLPYRYGTVRRPGPIYGKLPQRDKLAESEPHFQTRFPKWLEAGGSIGASFRPEVWSWGRPAPDAKTAWEQRLNEGVPPLLKEGQGLPSALGRPRPTTLVIDRMEPRVGHSFLHTFFSEGRRYGLTTQSELVPLDRYRPIVGSDFHGVELGKDYKFPLAFVRRPGSRFSDGTEVPYRSVLRLSGKKQFIGKRLHYETTDGKLISDQYASELRLARKMPAWATKGEKWISVSITKQTLVLYEGTEPVYATLVSTGEAGLADPDTTTATKRGIFRIHTKHITATMASDEVGEEFELRDVPYVQYFAEGGFALHGAYWHDRFGIPKSHGCINLAPEDARRLFYWTDPPVPPGWHGALLPLRGTRIFVHP